MAVTNKLTLEENGNSPDVDVLMSNHSFILYQQIQQWLNYLEEHTFTYTPINFSYELFTVDTATTATNFTYEGTGDTYDLDDGVTSGVLVFDLSMPNSVTIATAELVVNDTLYKSYQDEITNPSFESVLGAEWAYTETDPGVDWAGARDAAAAKVGSNGYRFTGSAISSASNAEITQTGVDLTNTDKIGCWVRISSTGMSLNNFAHIVIDSTTIVSINPGSGSGTWIWLSGNIPSILQTTGKSIVLKVEATAAHGANVTLDFDFVNIFDSTDKSDATYELSADGGSNWESVSIGVLHAFANTGTDLQVKITYGSTTGVAAEEVMAVNSIGVLYSA